MIIFFITEYNFCICPCLQDKKYIKVEIQIKAVEIIAFYTSVCFPEFEKYIYIYTIHFIRLSESWEVQLCEHFVYEMFLILI